MATGQPEGEGPRLDVAHLEALLAKTFNIGIDCGRGTEPVGPRHLRPPSRRRGRWIGVVRAGYGGPFGWQAHRRSGL
jgi:hypothetical protein